MGVQCTYEDCFRNFSSIAAMTKHKSQEHDRCDRCNEDFEDDTALLIHQIQSARHIACPMCGKEFKSSGGRDLHVDQHHRAPQENLFCAGCSKKFERAAIYMSHIEKGECSIIKPHDLYLQRAQAKIEDDAWAAALDPVVVEQNRLEDNTSEGDDEMGGVNLMDSRDAPQRALSPPALQPSLPHCYRAPSVPVHGMSNLSLNNFPTLSPAFNASSTPRQSSSANSDLMDLEERGQRIQQKPGQGAWKQDLSFRIQNSTDKETTEASLPPAAVIPGAGVRGPSTPVPRPSSDVSMANSPSNLTNNRASIINSQITDSDPKYNHRGVRTAIQDRFGSTINTSRYFDEITGAYNCPGSRCSRSFPDPRAFKDHLLSGVHADSSVTCPKCHKPFRTTTAFISHAESASKRCTLRHTSEYDQVIQQLTGNLLLTDGYLDDGSVNYVAPPLGQWKTVESIEQTSMTGRESRI